MYRKKQLTRTRIKIDKSYEGETIEQKIRRIVNNKEPITDGAEMIYTERQEGVQPGYDIRTDRWEIAVDAMDKVTKSKKAKREERHKTEEQKQAEKEAKTLGEQAKDGMEKEGGA